MKELKPTNKPTKYLEARLSGNTKKEAEIKAYGKDNHNSAQIEKTGAYKNALDSYLLENKEVAQELNKNIRQDNDRGAKNKAIDMHLKLKDYYPKDQTDIDAGDLSIVIRKKAD